MSDWKVRSVDSLSLFDQLMVERDQVQALPEELQEDIRHELSRLLNSLPEAKHLGPRLTFSAKTTRDGLIKVRLNGGGEIDAGEMKRIPTLCKTLRKVYDVARIQLPTCFSTPQPLYEIDSPDPLADPVVKNSFDVVRQEYQTAVFSDLNSIARNSLIAASKAARVVSYSGILGGVSGVYIGAKLVNGGIREYDNASKCDDTEGKINGALDTTIGLTYGTVGLSMITGFLPGVTDAALPQFDFMGPTGNAAMFGMGMGCLASGAYSLYHQSQFRDGLTAIIDDKKVSAQERARKGLIFLQQQLVVTDGEMVELISKYPDAVVREDKTKKLLQKKWSQFVRRVGETTAQSVAKNCNSLLKSVLAGDSKAVTKAVTLLQEVDKNSFKISVKKALLLFLGILYATLGLLSFAIPDSIALPILFAIGAFIWLPIDSQRVGNAFGNFVWKFKEDKEKWAPAAERPHFQAEMVSDFKTNESWNLQALKRQLTVDLDRGMKIHINGVAISNFNHLAHKLHLDTLDFTQTNVPNLGKSENTALEFLSILHQGIYAEAIGHTMDKNPGFDVVMPFLDGVMPKELVPHIYAHYNAETGRSMMTSTMKVKLIKATDPEDESYHRHVNLKVEFDGTTGRHWFEPAGKTIR